MSHPILFQPPPGYGQPGAYPYPPPYGYYDPYKQSPRRRATKGKHKSVAEVAERKHRKNNQSRARAARLRERISEIKKKPEDARTEDDLKVIEIFEERRRRKNERSRDRAIEKKQQLEQVLTKPESKRSKEEKEMLDSSMKSKARKNEGDCIRRERIKMMGLKGKGISVSVRGRPRRTLGPDGQPIPYDSSIPYAPGMDPNSVPMSPVPLHSPGPQFASPGMMSTLVIPACILLTVPLLLVLPVPPGSSRCPPRQPTTRPVVPPSSRRFTPMDLSPFPLVVAEETTTTRRTVAMPRVIPSRKRMSNFYARKDEILKLVFICVCS